MPLVVSHVAVTGPLVPSALQLWTLWPSQVDWFGTHSVHVQMSGAQISPEAVQSVVVAQVGVVPSQRWSFPTAQRRAPATHTGTGGGSSGRGCQRTPESKQLGAASPAVLARRSHRRLDPLIRRIITGAR
jgi:hypothetical protein